MSAPPRSGDSRIRAAPVSARCGAAAWLLVLACGCAKGPVELTDDLRDPDPFVRYTAVVALGACEVDEVRLLARHLFRNVTDEQDPKVRAECAATLRKLALRDASVLLDAVDLADLDDTKAVRTLDALLAGPGSAIVPGLVEELRTSVETRPRRLTLLVRMLREDAVPALVEMLADPRASRRRTAIWLLGAAGRDAGDAVPDLCAALDAPSELERRMAAESLIRIEPGDPRVQAALRPFAFDPDPRVRASALAPAIQSMIRDLGSDDAELRERAADDLARTGADGVRSLVERLEDPAPIVARSALTTLRDLGRRGLFADEYAPQHAENLRDSDPTLRACALLGSGMPRPPSVAELTAAIGDSSLRVRICAALALSWAGPDAREAAALLARMQLEDNALARQVAKLALGSIEKR